MDLTRHPNNPILKPNPDHPWENKAAFNGCPIKLGSIIYLLYRAIGDEVEIEGKRLRPSVVGIANSLDGDNFTDRRLLIKPETEYDRFGCEDPRITFIDGNFYIFYTAIGNFPPGPNDIRVALAISPDLITITSRKLITPFNAKAMALFPEKVNGLYTVILTADSDNKPAKIAIASFDDLSKIDDQTFWHGWYQNIIEYLIPLQRMNKDQVEVGAPPIKFGDNWLLIYSYIKNYLTDSPEFRIEGVLLDKNDPRKYIARIEKPILEPSTKYEKEGDVKNIVFPSGTLFDEKNLYLYYGASDTCTAAVMISAEQIKKNLRRHRFPLPHLIRVGDPLIKPDSHHPWEAKATFNPAAFFDGQKVHLLYRAMSFDNTSVFGYASSNDGLHINERFEEPVYLPRIDAETKKKPFANSGCEDPRLTLIDDTLYLLYTAYDGVNAPRVALTSILLDDFINHRWNWKNPVLISKPGIDDKDACLMPEKLDDRYVIFHRIGRNIVFDYADSLNLDGETFFEGSHQIMIREKLWDGERIGACAPPIKTDSGWLLLYHGVSRVDHEYRIGAMLLYPKHPSIVLARTPYPIFEPEMMFERFGHVNNVVFPCGDILRDNILFVYYGAGDQMTGVATIPLGELLGYLEETKNPSSLG